MVARPSLKRVAPGSVPPWRALCAESGARCFLFSSLCFPRVSKSVLLLAPKFGQILRALNLRAFWLSRARFLPRALVFRGPVVVSGCRNVFRGRAVVFHFRQSRKRASLSSSLRLGYGGTRFIEDREASNGPPSITDWLCCCNSAKHELEIIAKPLGCFMKHVVSWPLARRKSQLLSALATYCLPPANLSCSLLSDFCSSSPTFDWLSCAGVEADPW